ncbi:ketoacyl-ACP synthase III [Kutzneria viridogrisea]|uniref:3-oxoacyl-[acyl-carrier-protein] synthase III n=1 Tax=Kutzneria viridogrisea TaxID=47990 RepID=A0ABR6BAI3_9PSEU|nr:3-oxoacyl-[acyl-carrier-protein] synthase III [Kutzneria viridogrisea]
MRVDNLWVASLGVYLPERMSTDRAVELGLYDPADKIESGMTGVLIAGDRPPVQMALDAARQAVDRWGGSPCAIDLLVHSGTFAQGPPLWSPPGYLLGQLGGDAHAFVLQVMQACNGMLASIEVAAGQLLAGTGRDTALITGSENCASARTDRWRMSRPGMICADAGAAMMLSNSGGFARIRAIHSATVPELEGLHRGDEPLMPVPGQDLEVDLARRASEFGRSTMPVTDATELMIERQLAVVKRCLADAGLAAEDLARLIYANVAWYITDQWVMRPLGLSLARSSFEYGRGIGHAGPCDQVISLDHLVRAGKLRQGDHVLLLGAASGYCITGVVLTITDTPAWAG